MKMAGFASVYSQNCLLDIAKTHLDAIDRTRMDDGVVIGQDNFDRLLVATVFAAIAIEASLNDYVLSHCLFLENRYFQSFFGEITTNALRGPMDSKLKLLRQHWSSAFPDAIIGDVRRLFEIRNKIIHQQGIFSATKAEDDGATMTNFRLTADEMRHMLTHHEIATTFLSMFFLPGNQEVQQQDVPRKLGRAEQS
jgi:hypothetical protein